MNLDFRNFIEAMRIECTAGGGATNNVEEVKVKDETPPNTTPEEVSSNPSATLVEGDAKPSVLASGAYSTRGVKVRYSCDEIGMEFDDDYNPRGNLTKRRRTTRRAKIELPDIGGYRPTKKRVNRKDPNRCHVCRQR